MNALFQLNQMMAGDKVKITIHHKPKVDPRTGLAPDLSAQWFTAYVTGTKDVKFDENGWPYIYFGFIPYDPYMGGCGALRYYPDPDKRPEFGVQDVKVMEQQAQPPRSI